MLHVVGIRHHSPACSRVVRHVIERVRPRHVLIEGPVDLNPRMDELRLPHALPIAIFTYLREPGTPEVPGRRHASWTPFCSYSPEWIALTVGTATGADVRFCDLPAWHEVFDGRENRYADAGPARPRREDYVAALCRRYGVDDIDTLWDHLFEGEQDLDALAERLRVHFSQLRDDLPGGPRDEPREELMARYCAWAMRDGDVVLVCGGFHAPWVERRARALFEAGSETSEPTLSPPAAPVEHGSYLVPYGYRRLDAFAGYDAGMPSPAFYELAFELGPERAAEELLSRVTRRLRVRRQAVSTADLIAARTLAEALAAMRGHATLLRTDLLDGLAGALVKDGLEVPLPWARRGPMLPRTEPLLVEVVAALSGDREGRLADGTPRPPLVGDIERVLRAHDLEPAREARSVKLSLKSEAGRAKSRVLHRLLVLSIPGFTRASGPALATDVMLDEVWRLERREESIAAVIEASIYGATLEEAAIGRLKEALRAAEGRVAGLAAILSTAVFVGIEGFAGDVLDRLDTAAQHEPSFAALGEALATMLDVYLHGQLLGAAGAEAIERVLAGVFDRGLWLLEGLSGPEAPLSRGDVLGIAGLRDLVLRGPSVVQAQRARAEDTFGRRARDLTAPPAVRGGALGALWSLASGEESHEREALAAEATRAASLPERLGDFLGGLFGVARVEALHADGLLGAIDDVIGALGDHDLLVGLPSLRLAFTFFPPRERVLLAKKVLARRGVAASPQELLRAGPMPADLQRGRALEAEARALATRFLLLDGHDDEVAHG